MTSIVDELFFKRGQIDPYFVGVSQCRAGSLVWHRERGESEPAFLARCRTEASAAGYALLSISGFLPVSNVTRKCH